MTARTGRWFLAVCCALLSLTCREGTGPGTVVRVVILAPDTANVVGHTLHLYGVPYDARGVSIPGVRVQWQSLDATRAHVDSLGYVLLGPAAGDVSVTVTAAGGATDTVRLHAAAEGELRWAVRVAVTTSDFGGPALGPDGTVYVLSLPFPGVQDLADLTALSPHGTLRWSIRVDQTGPTMHLVGPTGDVFVMGSIVRAITPQGGIRWERPTGAVPGLLTGALGAGTPLVLAVEYFLALDPTSGATVWGPNPKRFWVAPPTIAGDTVWAKKSEDSLFSFSRTTGAMLTLRMADPDSGLDKRTFGVGPVPLADRIYLPTWSRLAAFDTQGQLQWLSPSRGRGMSEPVVDAVGNPYIQSDDGLVAIDRSTGRYRWQRPVARSRWQWYGGPAVGEGGVLYAAGLDAFSAYDTSGALRWQFQTMEDTSAFVPFIGAPAIAPDGTVYTYTDHYIYAFWASHPPEPNSPWPMWRHDAQRSGVAR